MTNIKNLLGFMIRHREVLLENLQMIVMDYWSLNF